ncbi:hypothetical protein Q5H92_24500 [Hymenobacter sp. M29]|uniref:Uncharacterized protein n=1 Tax=Hymenobacter mellowenesis TaxID=3063995 RepID=A0ABT9AKC9_9BACT|nr:hypothetical protein [Hymenobacter sp. M29]MDO7849546.1 hypothetical protein [Hymenobacter sp. M29]
MTPDELTLFTDRLVNLNQASVIVPMMVVWWRRRHFSPAVKLLSWYVYLSAFCSLGINFLYPAVFATNYGFLIGFNVGKTLLFGAVYYQVLHSAGARRTVQMALLGTVVCVAAMFAHSALLGVSGGRIMQCLVLAGFAMLYMEQTLNSPPKKHIMQDPFWLLGLGQLLYSAGTVTAFSLDYLSKTVYDQNWKYPVVALFGMGFNYFLTLTFLRAKHRDASTTAPVPAEQATLATS